jgi:signal peptide peptidase SppA
MGTWLAEPVWFSNFANAIKSGIHAETAIKSIDDSVEDAQTEDGIAVIMVEGMMMKGSSKFGGTSTVGLRRQIRGIMADESVKRVLLHVDSGGGNVAGTKELADDIAALNEKKPVTAFIEDLGASAAFWVASQATKVVANKTASIGSLGVVAVVQDTSEAFERSGVKVHVISTGEFKGAMANGTEVTEPMLADMQEHVNALHEIFMDAVADGRAMSREDIDAVADGRVFLADKALSIGLIDAVDSLDNTIAGMQESIQAESNKGRQNRITERLKRV